MATYHLVLKYLAKSTLYNILKHELSNVSEEDMEDIFYQKSDFALDLFLSIKDFQEKLYDDPSYFNLLSLNSSSSYHPYHTS